MAQIGTADIASRYDGIATGPRFAYLFETQEGIPVDGTNALLRQLSPFTLRLIPPDALLDAASDSAIGSANQNGTTNSSSTVVGSGTASVDLITDAAIGAYGSGLLATSVATALNKVTVTGTSGDVVAQLTSFIASGKFYTSKDPSVSTLADAFTAADIALQLEKMLAAEPLTLLVNPTEMTVQYTKVQTYQTRTRYGYVFEAWGEEQPTISFSGSTAGFVAGSADAPNPRATSTSSVSGYQAAARRDSAAWQNFAALYHFYRNNGYIYDTIGGSEAHLFIGAVAIDYDQWTYVGHIESFGYRFEEGSPLHVTFDMEFKISRMYDRQVSSATVSPMHSPTGNATSVPTGSGTPIQSQTPVRVTLSDGGTSQTPVELLGGGF